MGSEVCILCSKFKLWLKSGANVFATITIKQNILKKNIENAIKIKFCR